MNDIEVVAKITPGTISTNFEDIKAAVTGMVTAYEGLEVTEATRKERKDDLATLRKIRKAVDDRRKELEKEYNKPFDSFRSDVKSVLTIIDQPIKKLDEDLKALDAQRIAEKQEHLREIYAANIQGMEEYLPFDKLKKPQWDNASYKDSDIVYDINEAVLKTKDDISAIKAVESPIEELCLVTYKMDGLQAALKRHSEYVAAQKALEEKEKKAQEERKVLEEKDTLETPSPEWIAEKIEHVRKELNTEKAALFRIKGEKNINDVRQYFDFAGIPYEEVDG